MRISDWSSDVCSSDLSRCRQNHRQHRPHHPPHIILPLAMMRLEKGRMLLLIVTPGPSGVTILSSTSCIYFVMSKSSGQRLSDTVLPRENCGVPYREGRLIFNRFSTEDSRVGKESVSTCRFRLSTVQSKKKHNR